MIKNEGRSKHFGLAALALCILASPILAQTGKATRVTGVDAEYNTLITAYNSAQQKFYEPLERAKTDEERQKIRFDETKNPARSYLPRFQALARRAYRKDAGARALLEVIQLASQINDTKTTVSAANSLVTDYSTSPTLQQAATTIRYMTGQLGISGAAQLLHKIVNSSTNRTNKASAMYNLASMYSESQEVTAAQKAEAKSLFTKLAASYADTPYAKRASAAMFALDNLQIGMTSPDFEATDEAGKSFKLSDYRGKVVVLDFWGFW